MAASLPLPLCPPLLPPFRPPRRALAAAPGERPRIKKKRARAPPCGRGGLEPLYDDGFGSVGPDDYLEAVCDVVENDCGGGPPRWFCPLDCGPPVKDAPLLLLLPDVDGVGMDLFLHHKALGRIFEVRCMHVPIHDRTPFEGLVKFVEDVLQFEYSMYQYRPIYLVGHSFGGCLALSVAARNPDIDLILIISNPATSFCKSGMQPVLPVLRHYQQRLGSRVRMALSSMMNGHHPLQTLNELPRNLSSLLCSSNLVSTIPSDTFLWKLEPVKSASCYANSRLLAVKAEVLVLASGLDCLLPTSRDAVERLGMLLSNCKIHFFINHNHNLLLENGISLSTIIKGLNLYRRSRKHDLVLDFLPPSASELDIAEKWSRWLQLLTSPAVFSTLEDGKIVRGLGGIPEDGPLLLVGNHMLMGVELIPLIAEFLRERRVLVRGMGHPVIFPRQTGSSNPGNYFQYFLRVFGGVAVSSSNLYKLLSAKSFVLLYPGSIRETLHRKGEEHELFWPCQPEFVRMATSLEATIVPFGVVGEDDMTELVADYNDFIRIPFVKDVIDDYNMVMKLKNRTVKGDNWEQDFFMPLFLPKIPGRAYYLFGKSIITKGKIEVLKNKEEANALYLHVKSEVESMISYLLEKRENDEYRGIFRRILYQASWGTERQIPSFEP